MNKKVPIGSYVEHDDSYFPSLVQVDVIEGGGYMTDEALQLAQSVADKVIHVAIYGFDISEQSGESDDSGTYISPAAVTLSKALHQKWLGNLKKPIPSQEFSLEQAA